MLQAIKCILYQVYDWSRVDEAIISDILLQNGWIVNNENEEFQPLWFHISQQISYHRPLEKCEKISFPWFHS